MSYNQRQSVPCLARTTHRRLKEWFLLHVLAGFDHNSINAAVNTTRLDRRHHLYRQWRESFLALLPCIRVAGQGLLCNNTRRNHKNLVERSSYKYAVKASCRECLLLSIRNNALHISNDDSNDSGSLSNGSDCAKGDGDGNSHSESSMNRLRRERKRSSESSMNRLRRARK
jgi:hypothetical protein